MLIYMTLLVAVQRYACLCSPYRASLSCQRQQMRRYIVGVTVFAAVFTLPRFFEYDIVQPAVAAEEELTTAVWNETTAAASATTDHVLLTRWDIGQSDFSKNHIYRVVYFNLAVVIQADRVS